jgi:type II secretory ATPase GspE/PulE/Tfp pilus assembly ATPase PilB-like protein
MNTAITNITGLRASDLTDNRRVTQFLDNQGASLQALVSSQGHCFYVPNNQNRRVILLLKQLVEEHLGQCITTEITSLQFSQWEAHNRVGKTDRSVDTNSALIHYFHAAIDANASDVYIDIANEYSVISFRTYGYKRAFARMTREDGLSLTRSMFAMGGGASQFTQGEPCDCSFSLDYHGKEYRVRGNSIQDVRGNSVVCRVRDPHLIFSLAECGYSEQQAQFIERMCRAPGGMVLITGETNSGKSTTLAGLMAAEPDTKKIIEIADPVEVEFEHCTHVEINHYADNAEDLFRRLLAATVRQNPDVLVLGEIRDNITARAAMDMAIQGKRVYSTLHTQSCSSALPRLAGLGVDKDLLAHPAFIAGLVNQNLVPVTCQHCATDTHPDPATHERFSQLFTGAPLRFLNPKGCGQCRGGVASQTLVAEVYPLYLDRKGEAHKLIAANEFARLDAHMRSTFEIQSKHQHAASKIAAGAVDAAEVERIIGEFTPADVPDLATPQHQEAANGD